MSLNRFVRLAVAALLFAVPAAAQNAATTGAIRGRVTAADGAPLASAIVTTRNLNTGLMREVSTGMSGEYLFQLLPPGSYLVVAKAIGFQADTLPALSVTSGQTGSANFAMRSMAVQLSEIQVAGGRPPLDVADASVSQSVSRQEIDKLPSLGRDFTDFINISGLVSPNPERTTGGQFSITGLRPSQTNIQIDGVDANNSFFGENRGGSRIPFVFSLESIREFQVVTNGFDVEYGNYTGGVVNVVTRGGTNRLEGTLYGNYRGDRFTSNDFIGRPAADFSVTQYAGRLSGPLKRDKAFFFLSVDGQRRREPDLPIRPDYFLGKLDADGEAAPDSVGAKNFQRFLSILDETYGVTDVASKYQSFQTTNDVLTIFGRLDWNISDRHQLSLRENYANHSNDNLFNPGFDFNYGLSRAEKLGDRSSSLVGELQSVLSDRSSNVMRAQYSYEDRPRQGHDLRPSLTVVNIGNGQVAGFGGTFVSLDNDLREKKWQLVDNFTHSAGAHLVKFGFNGIYSQLYNSFVGPTGSIDNTTGDYTFASLDDFAAKKPSGYTRSATLDGSVPTSAFDVAEYGIYLQDAWRVTPRVTATLGLRYDTEAFLDNPARVIDAERAFGVTTGRAPSDKDNISPRLSLAWDLTGQATSVVRLGAGYFYGRLPYVVGGNVAGSVNPVLSLNCAGSAAEGAPDAPPSLAGYDAWDIGGANDPVTCAGGQRGTGTPTYTFWADKFEYPESFKASLGYDQLFGGKTKLSTNLIFSRSYKLYTVRDVNLRPAVFTLANEGDRQVFVPEAVFSPSSASSTALNSRLNSDFSQVYVNYNDGQAQSLAATAELSHSFSAATQLRLSYTYTAASDNSSYTCCTATEGFTNPRVGAFGPNDLGGVGDDSRAWGPSATVRKHVLVLSGNIDFPLGFRVGMLWRFQSGNRWGPEQGGDLNGDGVAFNDRPFIFAPEDLPLTETDPAKAQVIRDRYTGYLADNPCVGKYVGTIIPRNTCVRPWYNQMDLQIAKSIPAGGGHRVELQLDLFNVLNGINKDWGRYMGVFGANTDLLNPGGFDPVTKKILYNVPTTFGAQGVVGTNLLLQFQGQLGLRYTF